MLDFDQLDQALEAAVGIAPLALLQHASAPWRDAFTLARMRMGELAEGGRLSEAEVLERDRLGSFFGCAYGDNGLLARAGALHTIAARLERAGRALPALTQEPGAVERLRREADILRALGANRLSRPLHDDDRPLLEALARYGQALADLGEVELALQQAGRSLGVAKGGLQLYTLADLAEAVADPAEWLSASGIVGFVLGRLADRNFVSEARSLLDELCASRAAALRAGLWSLAEEGYARRRQPATLRELQELDVALELLSARLTDARIASAERAAGVASLSALLALAACEGARATAASLLDGALLLVAEGLAAEGPRPQTAQGRKR